MDPSRAGQYPEDSRIRDFFLMVLVCGVASLGARYIARLWFSPRVSESISRFALMFSANLGGFVIWDRRRIGRGIILTSALIGVIAVGFFYLYDLFFPGFTD